MWHNLEIQSAEEGVKEAEIYGKTKNVS